MLCSMQRREPLVLDYVKCERVLLQATGVRSFPGDFEREFSPSPTYLDPTGVPSADALAQSFQALHESVSQLVRDTAHAVVEKELGKP
jgi:hypothetical protein